MCQSFKNQVLGNQMNFTAKQFAAMETKNCWEILLKQALLTINSTALKVESLAQPHIFIYIYIYIYIYAICNFFSFREIIACTITPVSADLPVEYFDTSVAFTNIIALSLYWLASVCSWKKMVLSVHLSSNESR